MPSKRASVQLRILAGRVGIRTDENTTAQQIRDAWSLRPPVEFADQHDVAFEQLLDRECPKPAATMDEEEVVLRVPRWALEDLVLGARGRAYMHAQMGRVETCTRLNVVANTIAGEVK